MHSAALHTEKSRHHIPPPHRATQGKTLRIACTLVEDNRPEVGKALVDKMPVLKPALGENGENAVMYYLKDAKADFFQMMELVETVTF